LAICSTDGFASFLIFENQELGVPLKKEGYKI
jgi:hypothetical protein